jgi:hypothetical protein
MHYVRLLGECRELLHKVTLPRPEKELFIDIRSGKYLQDQVFEIGDALARECEQLLEKDGLPDAVGGPQAHGNSKSPKKAKRKRKVARTPDYSRRLQQATLVRGFQGIKST